MCSPLFMLRHLVAFAVALLLSMQATAALIRVGPTEAVKHISAAAHLAQSGDVVEIQPGTYVGDVAVWRQKELTIVGLGDGAVLDAHGQTAEGKAIWVIPDGNFHISNIAFQGARAPDRNGAGIRFEKGRLELVNCRFRDNQMGVLTAHDPNTVLIIRDSLFVEAPHQKDVLPHLLYIGRIGRAEIWGSRFERGYAGHLIKSRARETGLYYNMINDGPDGSASYEVDLPNGGDVTMLGNIIVQGENTQNPVVIAYGAEHAQWSKNRLRLSHNTLVNAQWTGAWFLRVWKEKLPDAQVLAVNNLTVGAGILSLTNTGEFQGNYPALLSMLDDPAAMNFRLATPGIYGGLISPAAGLGADLMPVMEFQRPRGTRSIASPERWSPGALQPEN